jgi:hypothetical protein
MKLLALATLALIGTVSASSHTYSDDLESVYALVCADHTQE